MSWLASSIELVSDMFPTGHEPGSRFALMCRKNAVEGYTMAAPTARKAV